MKGFFKALAVAFSIYSKIPMPHFEWAGKDMKYHLCFFPLVGAVIGALEFLWWLLKDVLCFGQIFYICISFTIPVFVTGGFHLDGFMDTMDAIHSYKPKDKKLEILEDPHIGAFSVISFAVYVLLCLGFGSELKRVDGIAAACFSFFISRAFSGLGVVLFPKAKKEGMLASESDNSSKRVVVGSLVGQLIVAFLAEFFLVLRYGMAPLFCSAAQILSFVFYYFFAKKQFGGINGDLAGFFVCLAELVSIAAAALSSCL